MNSLLHPDTPSCADAREPDLLPLSEARRRILQAIPAARAQQRVAVREALGRVLATDVVAPHNVPGHTNSAVDGYAFAGGATQAPQTLTLVGESRAGHPYAQPVATGQCVRILTGAAMPDGTDTVVMQEHCRREGDQVNLHRPLDRGANVRQAGEDLSQGAVALARGTRVLPPELGLLASMGVAEVAVTRKLRIAFFSTGDELCPVGTPLPDGGIYDSNRYSVYGMIERLGMQPMDLGVVADEPGALQTAMRQAADSADAIITTGGVSVGDADHVRPAMEKLGAVDFWKIAIKPGRPFAFGRLDDAWLFGLPGNPVAVMVTFYQLVQPALLQMAGAAPSPPLLVQARCTTRLRKKPGRTEFLRAVVRVASDGALEAASVGAQGSGILSSMSRANSFIVLEHERGDVQAGEKVPVQLFEGLM